MKTDWASLSTWFTKSLLVDGDVDILVRKRWGNELVTHELVTHMLEPKLLYLTLYYLELMILKLVFFILINYINRLKFGLQAMGCDKLLKVI